MPDCSSLPTEEERRRCIIIRSMLRALRASVAGDGATTPEEEKFISALAVLTAAANDLLLGAS